MVLLVVAELYEQGLVGGSRYWGHALKKDIGIPLPSFFLFPRRQEVSNYMLSTMKLYLNPGLM